MDIVSEGKESIVIKGDREWFFSVPAGAIMDRRLSNTDVTVLFTLYMLSNNEKGINDLGIKKLSQASKVSIPTFQTSVKKLEKLGWIKIIKSPEQFEPNSYKLIMPDEIPA